MIYHCDLKKVPLQPHIFREVTVKGFNPSEYQTTQVSREPIHPSIFYLNSICLSRAWGQDTGYRLA